MIIEDNYADVVASVKEQIDYDYLLTCEKMDPDLIDCVVELIAEAYTSKEPETFIARERRSMEVVKERFLHLTSEHIIYVFDCMNATETEVKNIKQYLRAVLFNAPATMGAYYGRKVHEHQMGIGCRKSE